MRNGPALWDALLDAVRPHTDKDLVVAGGCLRDYALEVEPKDIDIFVACTTRHELEQLGDKLNASAMFDLDLIEVDDSYKRDDPDLIGVLEGEALGVPVNIIARPAHTVYKRGHCPPCECFVACAFPPDDVPDVPAGRQALLDGFDFDILKASYDGTCPEWSQPCLLDIAGRTATLAHERHRQQSFVRFERFNIRNPGVLRMVDPFTVDELNFD